MKFLAVDDEELVLRDLERTLHEVLSEFELKCFGHSAQALEYLQQNEVEVAFLDIEMGNISGIELAKQFKEIQPSLHIIFVTAYPQYAVEAFAIHATGYLLKPVLAEDLKRELTFIYKDLGEGKRVRIQTFGGFAMYVDGEKIDFARNRTRELMAYLVDRRGGAVTTREMCAVLWEDEPYSVSQKNYFHQLLHDLRNTLNKKGVGDILIKRRNSISLDTSKVECDCYQFLKGDAKAVNSYWKNYLPEYSWAEFTIPTYGADL